MDSTKTNETIREWWRACSIEPRLLALQIDVVKLTRGDLWSVLSWSDRLANLRDDNPQLVDHFRGCHAFLLDVHDAALRKVVAK